MYTYVHASVDKIQCAFKDRYTLHHTHLFHNPQKAQYYIILCKYFMCAGVCAYVREIEVKRCFLMKKIIFP